MSFVARYQRELAVLAVYLLLLAVLAIVRPVFFQGQFAETWVSAAPVLIVAVGVTLVIIARQIDISVGSQFSVCAVLVGLGVQHGLPMPLAVLGAVAAGACFGAINGFFVAVMRLPSIVVTLATMVILRESLSWAREGADILGLPNSFQYFGLSIAAGKITRIVVAAVIFALAAWGMRYLQAGRTPYAVGSDEEAARLAGVRPVRVTFWVFVVAGALTGLAATLEAVRMPQVATNLGLNLELKVIAAVVIGGVAITGGRGTLFGTLIGVALLATVRPGLGFLGLRPDWEKAFQGAIILIAVGSEALFRRGGASHARGPNLAMSAGRAA